MDLEQQLRAALAPVRPAPQVRAAVMGRVASRAGRRGPGRWVLAGAGVALVAAAAAMLTLWQAGPVASTAAVDASVVPASPAVEGGGEQVPQDARALPATGGESQPVQMEVTPFTVQVLPLETDVVDEPRKVAIEAVYAAFVEGLRTIPGLTLVDATNERRGPTGQSSYRLTLRGATSTMASGDYTVEVETARTGPDGRTVGGFYTGTVGKLAPGCVTPASADLLASDDSCADPRGVAAGLLASQRKIVFPLDPQLRQRLQARLADERQDARERLRALEDLWLLGRSSGARRDGIAAGLRDPDVVRAASQLASTSPDPAARAQVWYVLRGSRDPALVPPLVTALRTDVDDDARVQALVTLEADFTADPRARAALESAAAGDSNPMVRALAQRALGSEPAWTDYVIASLKDTGRSPSQRVEALFLAYGVPSPRGYGVFAGDDRILRALDDAAIRALVEVLPGAAGESRRYDEASGTVMNSLSYLDHPAITRMVLDDLDGPRPRISRSNAVLALRRHADDAEVRSALQRIAAEDADPQVRRMAGGSPD